MWPWKSRRATDGSVTLLLARVEDMHAVADSLTAEALQRLLGGIVGSCEERVEAAGGHVVTWDPSAVGGSLVLCAWIDGPRTAALDFPGIAREILTGIRKVLDAGLPSGAPKTRIRLALSRGQCHCLREGRHLTRVLGDPVNRVHRLLGGIHDGADALVVDASLGAAGAAP